MKALLVSLVGVLFSTAAWAVSTSGGTGTVPEIPAGAAPAVVAGIAALVLFIRYRAKNKA